MFTNHPRSGITHHSSHLLPAISMVTMHRTFPARGLFSAKPAPVQPPTCIIQQPLAFAAQFALMMITAINADHGFNSFPFPCQMPARLPRCDGGFGNRANKSLFVNVHGWRLTHFSASLEFRHGLHEDELSQPLADGQSRVANQADEVGPICEHPDNLILPKANFAQVVLDLGGLRRAVSRAQQCLPARN